MEGLKKLGLKEEMEYIGTGGGWLNHRTSGSLGENDVYKASERRM